MSIYGYKPKTRPALWRTMQPPEPVKAVKRIQPVSEREKVRKREYMKVKREYFKTHQKCEACLLVMAVDTERQCFGVRSATSIHHVRGRLGKLLSEPRFWKAVCDPCHTFIHANPSLARALGLLAQPGEWHKQP